MRNQNKLDISAHGLARRHLLTGTAIAAGALAVNPILAWAGDAADEISHTAESIHQEPVFQASRKRIYDVLVDAKQFEKIVQQSMAAKSMNLGNKPAQIDVHPGGVFSLFGGYITGRQIELVPNERIVQAWRAGSWEAGIYSIVRFSLVEQGEKTKIVFDHTGFPLGQAAHLLAGWNGNYWEPLTKYLAAKA